MKSRMIRVAAALAALLFGSLALADEAQIRRVLESSMSGVKVEGIQPGPIPGLFEVRVRSVEGVQVLYTDANASHIIVGSIYESLLQPQLTDERARKLNAISSNRCRWTCGRCPRGIGKRVVASYRSY